MAVRPLPPAAVHFVAAKNGSAAEKVAAGLPVLPRANWAIFFAGPETHGGSECELNWLTDRGIGQQDNRASRFLPLARSWRANIYGWKAGNWASLESLEVGRIADESRENACWPHVSNQLLFLSSLPCQPPNSPQLRPFTGLRQSNRCSPIHRQLLVLCEKLRS